MAEKDSLNGTSNAAIYLRKIENDVEQRRIDRERELRLEEEKRFEEWLSMIPKIPDDYYQDEAQEYDYIDA